MRLRSGWLLAAMLIGVSAFPSVANGGYYVEYYRDNLFLGLAYHRIGCMTDWNTVQSNQDYDGFTTQRYCYAGAGAASVPGAEWYDYQYLGESRSSAQSRLDYCGSRTNDRYGTWGYSARSSTCGYNIFTDCNSDCWIRAFSQCSGKQVAIASPCW